MLNTYLLSHFFQLDYQTLCTRGKRISDTKKNKRFIESIFVVVPAFGALRFMHQSTASTKQDCLRKFIFYNCYNNVLLVDILIVS